MPTRLPLLALLASLAWGQSPGAPSYSAADLVNAATNLPGPLAPNTWASIRGSGLSWTTASAGPADIVDNRLPVRIVGAGVTVLFAGGTPAHLLYVSPPRSISWCPLPARPATPL